MVKRVLVDSGGWWQFWLILVIVVLMIPQARGECAFLYEEHETKSGIAVEIVAMKAFAPKKAQPFVQFHGCRVGDFCLECNLTTP